MFLFPSTMRHTQLFSISTSSTLPLSHSPPRFRLHPARRHFFNLCVGPSLVPPVPRPGMGGPSFPGFILLLFSFVRSFVHSRRSPTGHPSCFQNASCVYVSSRCPTIPKCLPLRSVHKPLGCPFGYFTSNKCFQGPEFAPPTPDLPTTPLSCPFSDLCLPPMTFPSAPFPDHPFNKTTHVSSSSRIERSLVQTDVERWFLHFCRFFSSSFFRLFVAVFSFPFIALTKPLYRTPAPSAYVPPSGFLRYLRPRTSAHSFHQRCASMSPSFCLDVCHPPTTFPFIESTTIYSLLSEPSFKLVNRFHAKFPTVSISPNLSCGSLPVPPLVPILSSREFPLLFPVV